MLLVAAALMSIAVVAVLAAGASVAGAVAIRWLKDLPDYKAPRAYAVAQTTNVYSADGVLLARFYSEDREVVPISQIATSVTQGVVAIEDARFYEHQGVDFYGIARAAVANLQGRRQGASTITQQYVRNTVLVNERTQRTMQRKVREAYLAMELEKRWTKAQVLEAYLNTVYFGHGAYGAQAAAKTYFGKGASELTLSEGALVAGLAQSPARDDPFQNPDGAIARRNDVLEALYVYGYITAADRAAALAAPLGITEGPETQEGALLAPYFVSYVRGLLQDQFGTKEVFTGGLTVYTTLDTRLQSLAEKSAHADLKRKKDPEVALVAIEPQTGYVKAMVGGRSYARSKFNLATQAHRQAGSAFKTFVLVTALSQGMPPSFKVDSSQPAVIPAKPKPWEVENSEGQGYGMMPLDEATWHSVNAVFARVAWAVGTRNVIHTAHKMGITTRLPKYPSVALGTVGVTPLEMASAYSTLANAGVHHEPVVITKVVDSTGRTIYEAAPHASVAVGRKVTRAAIDIMRGVVQQGTATAADIGRPQAGKTGTSQSNRDLWFVGFTPKLCTAVWVGYPKERTVVVDGSRGFGGTVAAPIWARFMKKALKKTSKKDFAWAPDPHYDATKFDLSAVSSGSSSTNVGKP